MQACRSAQRCRDGPYHALLDFLRPRGDCVTCCMHKNAETECPPPPQTTPTGPRERSRIFPQIFRAFFLCDSGLPILTGPKCPKKICAPGICVKICAKPGICIKTNRFARCKKKHRFAYSGFQKMDARKTKKKKKLRQIAQNPSPKRPRGRGGGKQTPCLPKPLHDSLHSIPPHRGPLSPRPFLWAKGGGECENDKVSASECPAPSPQYQ